MSRGAPTNPSHRVMAQSFVEIRELWYWVTHMGSCVTFFGHLRNLDYPTRRMFMSLMVTLLIGPRILQRSSLIYLRLCYNSLVHTLSWLIAVTTSAQLSMV